MRFIKIPAVLIPIFLLAGFLSPLFAAEKTPPAKQPAEILFFHSESCHACQKVKNEILPAIEKEFSERIAIKYLDIADINNYQELVSLKEKYNLKTGVPMIFTGDNVLSGYRDIKRRLRDVILITLKEGGDRGVWGLPRINIAGYFLSFGSSTIIIAGLIDGINPCAFAVIVFFMSFLALQGYRKREVLIIGFTFIAAVFLTYVLIGLGIFRFLYALRNFYLITKALYYAIAAFCFALTGFAVYDLWLFLKTGGTEGMALQLPQRIKNIIHSVIGARYRKPARQGNKNNLLKLTAGTFATGFLIAVLEGICTGQLYLPTIAFMMKDASLRVRAFGYLLLYNLMFIIPLFIVMGFAFFGATSENFSRFMKRHMATVKFSMAVLFAGLGVIILLGA